MSNTIKVPVTFYQDVTITDEKLIEILNKEKKKLLPSGWDCLVFYKDSRVTLYERGYGSHNIGEREEDCHDEELIRKYKAIKDTIEIIKERKEK